MQIIARKLPHPHDPVLSAADDAFSILLFPKMVSLLDVSLISLTAQELSEGQSELAAQRNQIQGISPSSVQGSLISLEAALAKVFRSQKDLSDGKNIPFIFTPGQTIRLLAQTQTQS